jgi:nucleotide-binding universal stress UspA family protein
MARALQVGQLIDGFRLEEELPCASMSSLWRVSRPDLPFAAIMKLPLLQRGENTLAIVAFEVERMILPRLTGSHVPRFIAAGDFEGPYIVMELVEGTSLKARLADVPLPPGEVAVIGGSVAFALHDIHRQHVVHLDVKPSNVIMRADGQAVLIDFGLSRHAQLPDLPAEEVIGPIGTGAYIAPEQLLGVRNDPRSDLFSLGVILYFLATGERPFGDPPTVAQWRRRLYDDPLPPRGRRPDIPPWLQEIILRCLEIDPQRRHRTAAQLSFDLQHPDQVVLTERATRMRPARSKTMSRWLDRFRLRLPVEQAAAPRPEAPIIVAAVDLSAPPAMADTLRAAVLRLLQTIPGARLACVNVMRISRLKIDAVEDEAGRNLHLQRLAELKHWARPIAAAPDQITYHVFEAVDPAAALIDFSRKSHADHIVMGARGSSSLRRYLGSVSSRVVAEATCSVTVVRAGADTQHTAAGESDSK